MNEWVKKKNRLENKYLKSTMISTPSQFRYNIDVFAIHMYLFVFTLTIIPFTPLKGY